MVQEDSLGEQLAFAAGSASVMHDSMSWWWLNPDEDEWQSAPGDDGTEDVEEVVVVEVVNEWPANFRRRSYGGV